ncbi:MAG: hypothetical protein RM368_10090 [Nostoc sp. DedSLP03]|nr:hypothetical protein [Nostoc sp. DedSLP03]MDZ7965311.1 hypothetical protein [Nostoc sp. DedSLP03]
MADSESSLKRTKFFPGLDFSLLEWLGYWFLELRVSGDRGY